MSDVTTAIKIYGVEQRLGIRYRVLGPVKLEVTSRVTADVNGFSCGYICSLHLFSLATLCSQVIFFVYVVPIS